MGSGASLFLAVYGLEQGQALRLTLFSEAQSCAGTVPAHSWRPVRRTNRNDQPKHSPNIQKTTGSFPNGKQPVVLLTLVT